MMPCFVTVSAIGCNIVEIVGVIELSPIYTQFMLILAMYSFNTYYANRSNPYNYEKESIFEIHMGRSLSVLSFLHEQTVRMLCAVPLLIAAQCAEGIDVLTSVEDICSEGAARGNPDHGVTPSNFYNDLSIDLASVLRDNSLSDFIKAKHFTAGREELLLIQKSKDFVHDLLGRVVGEEIG